MACHIVVFNHSICNPAICRSGEFRSFLANQVENITTNLYIMPATILPKRNRPLHWTMQAVLFRLFLSKRLVLPMSHFHTYLSFCSMSDLKHHFTAKMLWTPCLIQNTACHIMPQGLDKLSSNIQNNHGLRTLLLNLPLRILLTNILCHR